MDEQPFVLAFRKRLGCHVLPELVVFKFCGNRIGTRIFHMEFCARSQCTLGHYNVVMKLVDCIQLNDSCVCTEVRGLSDTSSALPRLEAALDVTIVYPEAAHAGQNCFQ